MVYVFLADGFEEVEALAPIDMLRRAGIEVKTVGVGSTTPTGSHGVTVMADISEEIFYPDDNTRAIVLPGGTLGAANLEASDTVQRAIRLASDNITIAAICAAPTILGRAGLLQLKKATAHPTRCAELGDSYVDKDIVYDAPYLTGRAAGMSIDFGLKLVELLKDKETADNIAASICHERKGN